MKFEEYVEKTLAQTKPHHVLLNVCDWLLWQSDEWEEIGDSTGSTSGERRFRRVADGAVVEVYVRTETENDERRSES
jgi:hypothetical protein